MPNINPEVLRWARETAGLTLEEAAGALHLGRVRVPGADVLRGYEEGNRPPSRPILLKMVKTYRRPLLAFYLNKPPVRGERGEDFRTIPAERRNESAGPLDALVRDVYVRQRLVRTTLEDAEEAITLSFVKSIQLNQSVDEVSKLVKEKLDFELETFRRSRTIEEAFKYLRTQVERTGIFVLLIGNLGSHHSNVSVDVFRGFALADNVAPFIVINDQDAKSAWSFTVLHELVHIWLGQTGISGGPAEQKLERFCNNVASQLLLPDAELNQWVSQEDTLDGLTRDISTFADARKVSRTMVTYRLYQAGKLSRENWQALTDRFREIWLQDKAASRAAASDSNGPTYYVVRRHRLGGALIDLVKRTVAEGILTPTKAGRVLGVRPNNVATLVNGL